MNKENSALKLVDEIILYYDARSNKHKITEFMFMYGFKRCTLKPKYMVSGFRRQVYETCALLGYYAAGSANSLQTFRYNLSVPSSRVKKSKDLGISWHLMKIPGRLNRNDRNELDCVLKCDGTCAETRFRLSAKWTRPFKLARASVHSTAGFRGVYISGSNAGYTMFWGSVKSTGYPLHSTVSPSLPFPCVAVCHHISTGLHHYTLRNIQEVRRSPATSLFC